MRWAFFESMKDGCFFIYHFNEYKKINDTTAERTDTHDVVEFKDNQVVFIDKNRIQEIAP